MNSRLLLTGVALGGCVFASTVDTTQVYSSGLPAIEFTFNSDGQAFTADGIPVNGITFGFNPSPPTEPTSMVGTPWVPAPTVIDQPTIVVPLPTPVPASDTPEPRQFVISGLALLALSLSLRRYPRA